MDDRTLEVLDFPAVREMLADCAQTDMGRQSARSLMPCLTRGEIEYEMDLVDELTRVGEEPVLACVGDIREKLATARSAGILQPGDILTIAKSLAALGDIRAYLSRHRSRLPKLSGLETEIRDFSPLCSEIRRVLDKFGEVRDEASSKLRQIRLRLRRMRSDIVQRLERIASEQPELFRDARVGVRNGRYVLPLKSEARNRFEGILHDTSESGRTLFVEPLLLLTEQNELSQLRRAEQEEVDRVLRQLCGLFVAEEPAIVKALGAVAKLDMACARKRLSTRLGSTRPTITDRGSLRLMDARHPLLATRSEGVVPLQFVPPQDARVVLISGPNAGGKTVAIKTLGLLTLMVKSGLLIPAAEGSEVPLFEQVLAVIGDEQSLEANLSSFSAQLQRTRAVLEKANNSSLVLFDEIGGSTSQDEGSALAIAVLIELNRLGATVVATSHLGPLKAFVEEMPGMINAAMEFKGTPTYRLVMGLPGESSALEIAASLGFPSTLLNVARDYLDSSESRLAELLCRLRTERTELQQRLCELASEHKRAAALRQEMEARMSQLNQQEAEQRKRLQAEREALLHAARRDIENLVRKIREEQASKQAIRQAKDYIDNHLATDAEPRAGTRSLMPLRPDLKRLPLVTVKAQEGPRGLKPGDPVYSTRLAREGIVAHISGSNVTVGFGRIKIQLPQTDLTVLPKVATEPEPVSAFGETEAFDPRLNLRGMNLEEARARVELFMDQVELHGARYVTIVHGKGTGTLRQMVWDVLRRHPRVTSYRLGSPTEGGSGVTFVTIEA
ncbi:MAG: endonuclease MutS2 [candidate division WOR-3 bacterium]